MSSAGRLTQREIKALTPKAGEQYVVWDDAIPGFGVRVNPKGSRTFVLKYRLHSGRVRWKTLGRFGAITLEQARKHAKDDIGIVARGGDPLRTKDTARDAVTFGDVADRFLEEHVEARRKPSTLRNYTLAINTYLRPRLGATPIADLTTEDFAKIHHRLRGAPYMANRMLATASKLMNWAATKGLRGEGPHGNPTDAIEKYPERPRKRYLSPEELKRVGAALRVAERRQRMTPGAIAALRLLLLTGARSSEILSLKWSYVHLAAAEIRLPDSKTGAKTIVLSAPALDILKSIPKWARSPYVFPGEGRGEKRKGAHRVNLTDAWAWVRKRAKIPDVRIHDLRHSFASVTISQGQTLAVVGALLGHTQAQTTQRYAHLMDDPLRAATKATGDTIGAALVRRRA